MSRPELTNLPEGAAILAEKMPGRETVALGIWVRTGSRHEPARLQGISHFLEHMLFKGTGRRSCRQISQAIEGVGGSLNAFTSEECTCYWARVGKKHLVKALDVLLDMVRNPRLAPDDLERERGVILEEMRMYRDNPAYHVHELIQEIMWPEQPLGRAIVGAERTIGGMSRADLAGYHRDRYAAAQVVVVACGAVEPETLPALVRERLGEGSMSRLRGAPKAVFNRSRRRVVIDTRPIEQANLSLGLPGLNRNHPRRYALLLLSVLLGGNMSSRLFHEIREKRGWVYSIRTDLDFYRDSGDLVINAGLPPEKLPETVGLIGKELARLRDEPPKESELGRAREYYLGQTDLSLEKTSSRMFWLGGTFLGTGRVPVVEEIREGVQAVTTDAIRDLAREIFRPGSSCAAVIGPVPADTDPATLLPL